MSKNFLKSSIENASLNILLQIGFRCLTFVLNACVLRHVSQDEIGITNVRLLLLESTVLFLSREAFRRACLTATTQHDWPKVINLIWLSVPLCIGISGVCGYVWLNLLEQPNISLTLHYKFGVWSILISCVMELCSEQLYIVGQAFLFVRVQIALEIINITIRTIIYTTLVMSWSGQNAVLAFSFAQLASIFIYTLSFYAYFWYYLRNKNDNLPFNSMWDLFPKIFKKKWSECLDFRLVLLLWSFLKQGFMKQLLTDGERYVMTFFNTLKFNQQGVYDIINNLGSLAARFLFRPVETASYFYFSQLVHRDVPIKKQIEQDSNRIKEVVNVLECLLRVNSSIGLVVLSFGQAYAKLALYLYGGSALAVGIGPIILKMHCLSILFLAVNGIIECYAAATMNITELNQYNVEMVYLSVIFIFISFVLSSFFGGLGFILANCCNFAFRIIQCGRYIISQYKNTNYSPLKSLIPKKLFLMTLILSTILTLYSENIYFENDKVFHVLFGAILFFITVSIWLFEEISTLKFLN
ncbi:protein RFT1 homolog isoform X2 [Daktulosphaira vitifoliae]|uniref:protein RFT1 homolog isoform X2 n=1 Tax=Daktulosphaira vitifoliae TaxID=58002 RepID=UPI0021A9E511|nr:protein RFT1 homolog isoform X2 [Daktulosphaira vitifoliae]